MKDYIKLSNVTKTLKGNTVLNNISIEFEKNKVYGIEGINGSGKTMLLRAICGLVRTEGTITVDGLLVGGDKFPKNIGILIESPAFLNEFTGKENLKLLSFLYDDVTDSDIDSVIEKVGLNPADKRHYGKYSLGMKQRLGIAQAILGCPDLVLLDEPTNALDAEGINRMKNIVTELKNAGSTVLIASHDKDFIEEVSDSKILIDRGVINEVVCHG